MTEVSPSVAAAAESGPAEEGILEAEAGEPKRGYGRGAGILSIGIATTGVVTFAYFAVASHVLPEVQYKGISLLWSVMFVVISIIYRPIEQLLSRTIADRRARGHEEHPYRVPVTIQASFAALFAVIALLLKDPLENDVFDGSSTLYWVLVVGTLAYAASYFARGWLAGHERFGLYGGLVFLESTSRFLFALAAAIGITHGQGAVAMGIAAAPFVSLVVVPWAFSRRRSAAPAAAPVRKRQDTGLSMSHGIGFAVSVLGIMLAEQTLLNAAVITTDITASDAALAGFVFNVLLIARAPLQLFQSIQTSLLPHLTGLEARAGAADFGRAIRITVLAITAFAGAVALVLLAIGPWAMNVLFGGDFHYGRVGLAVVALGMGLHLIAGTLNQAALARQQAALAAGAWLLCAALFVGFVLAPTISNQILRVEVAYFGAAGILSGLLFALYRRQASDVRARPPTPDARRPTPTSSDAQQ
jgi:O-antigen/teichoic acid export membrane protein